MDFVMMLDVLFYIKNVDHFNAADSTSTNYSSDRRFVAAIKAC